MLEKFLSVEESAAVRECFAGTVESRAELSRVE
jgi:hypothetical protein